MDCRSLFKWMKSSSHVIIIACCSWATRTTSPLDMPTDFSSERVTHSCPFFWSTWRNSWGTFSSNRNFTRRGSPGVRFCSNPRGSMFFGRHERFGQVAGGHPAIVSGIAPKCNPRNNSTRVIQKLVQPGCGFPWPPVSRRKCRDLIRWARAYLSIFPRRLYLIFFLEYLLPSSKIFKGDKNYRRSEDLNWWTKSSGTWLIPLPKHHYSPRYCVS